jgi:[ribosomal protein S5]-alanine N-acetyltransferase
MRCFPISPLERFFGPNLRRQPTAHPYRRNLLSRNDCPSLHIAMVYLETERLLFRSHEPQDEPDFVDMHTDPEVRRYVGGRAWPMEEAQRRFRRGYVGHPNETYGLWATIFKPEQRYIGACGITSPPNQSGQYLGFYIARPYWGRGLATEACKTFLEHAFARLYLPRVFADVEKGHAVSEHILRKCGFLHVRDEQVANSARVISVYELSRDHWRTLGP